MYIYSMYICTYRERERETQACRTRVCVPPEIPRGRAAEDTQCNLEESKIIAESMFILDSCMFTYIYIYIYYYYILY